MDLQNRPATAVCAVVFLLLAGCLSVGGVGGSGGQPQTTTAEQPRTPTPVESGCPTGLAFYGLGSPGDFGWSSEAVAVGYSLPPDSSALLVAFDGETVLGTTKVHNTNPEHALAADGHRVALDDPLDGSHEIRVTAFRDSDGDGEFDPETDAPCLGDDGEPVTTGPHLIDFEALQTQTTD
ncbi:hypothetical protein [Halobacterium rubrum]|uniref:hypothetical protein n=1 Tax=Halobacterium TaxID=2239 RepID=UPI001F3F5DF0|nr:MULTISPECIES: hypothetical protein [Halobacterium]MDH5020843.1 hypothetical protein [Halobacterium rubrum]